MIQRSKVPIRGLLKTSQCICIYCLPAGPQEIMGHSMTLCDLLLTTFISNHIQTNKDDNLKKGKVNCARLVCHLGNGYGREKGTFCLLEKLERQTHDGRDCVYYVSILGVRPPPGLNSSTATCYVKLGGSLTSLNLFFCVWNETQRHKPDNKCGAAGHCIHSKFSVNVNCYHCCRFAALGVSLKTVWPCLLYECETSWPAWRKQDLRPPWVLLSSVYDRFEP